MDSARFDSPHTDCHWCDSPDIREIFVDHRECHIYECSCCRVQFMNPQYSDAYLADYYSKYIRIENEWEEPRVALQQFYLSLISRHTGPLRTLFDIGTGSGYMLTAAKQAGINPMGYDVDPESAKRTAEIRGAPVYSGDLTSVPIEPGSLDAISMHHVLEHLKDPLSYVDQIQRLLRPGGTLFIAVPNIASVSILTKSILETLHIRQANLGRYYDTSHHLFYYTPGTLSRRLKAHGFEVLHRRGCHRVRPGDSSFRRWFNRNVYDRPTWRSGFLLVARWSGGSERGSEDD